MFTLLVAEENGVVAEVFGCGNDGSVHEASDAGGDGSGFIADVLDVVFEGLFGFVEEAHDSCEGFGGLELDVGGTVGGMRSCVLLRDLFVVELMDLEGGLGPLRLRRLLRRRED